MWGEGAGRVRSDCQWALSVSLGDKMFRVGCKPVNTRGPLNCALEIGDL